MKRIFTFLVFALMFTFTNAQFTTKWETSAAATYSAATNGFRWLISGGDRASSLAFNKATGNVLVTQRGTTATTQNITSPSAYTADINPGIIVLNANTGDSITSLSLTGIPAVSFGLQHNFQKIRVDDNGVIYAISLCLTSGSNTPANTATLRVLRWANQSANPTECARFQVTERVGDAFGLSGTGVNTILYCSGNAVLGTSPNFTSNIYALTTTDGVSFNTINTITIQQGTSNAHWGRGALEPTTNSVTSDIWIKSSSLPARRITIGGTAPTLTGTVAFTTADGTGNGQFANTFSQMGFLRTPSNKLYIAGASGAAATPTPNTHLFKMIDITSEASPADIGTDNLTNSPVNANGNASGDVAFKDNGNGSYDIFYMSTNNGIKCITSATTLPVTLTSFNGSINGNIASLNWTTANEVNNKGFEVERSANGTSFINIGFVAAGNGNYNFTDGGATNANNYYRLKQVDKDGKFTYSNVLLLSASKATNDVKLFGNPVANKLVGQATVKATAEYTLTIIDNSGRMLLNQRAQFVTGVNQFEVNTTELKAGVYYLQIISGSQKSTTRFAVEK